MFEILVILIVLGATLLLPWIGGWDPETLLIVITVVINLINLGMTVINLIQARRQDPRFMNAASLGGVQFAVGAGLLAVFLPTLGDRMETWLCGAPFLVGGFLTLVVYSLTPKRERNPPPFTH